MTKTIRLPLSLLRSHRINSPAGPGPDLATGAGLVDAAVALPFALDQF